MKSTVLATIMATIAVACSPTSALALANSGDFSGAVAIGTGYAGIVTAPLDGLAVQRNVGIGTASPTNSLSFSGSAAQTIWMERNPTSNTAGNSLTLQGSGATTGATNKGGGTLFLSSGISTGTGNSNIQFLTYPAGTSGTSDNGSLVAATLSASGTSGSNAATTLQANAGSGTDQNGGNLTLASGISTGTGSSSIFFQVYDPGSSGSSANTPNSFMTILPAPSSTTLPTLLINTSSTFDSTSEAFVQIVTSGNAAIATKTAISTAQSALSFFNPNGRVGFIQTNGSNTSYNTSSDRRLKENIVDTTAGLAQLERIHVRDFNFKADPKKARQQGFIAQELYEVYPEAVSPGNDNSTKEPWSVDYGRLTPLLVKAIQELKADNDELHAVVEKQARDFDSYRKAHP